MIRTMVAEDLPRMIDLLEILHAKSPYAQYEIEWPLVEQLLHQGMMRGAVFVHERRGKLNGFIISGLKPLWWNPRIKLGTDVFFMPGDQEAGVELLNAACGWCFRHGANRMECGISSFARLEDVRPIYIAAGFTQQGSLFHHEFERTEPCPASSTM